MLILSFQLRIMENPKGSIAVSPATICNSYKALNNYIYKYENKANEQINSNHTDRSLCILQLWFFLMICVSWQVVAKQSQSFRVSINHECIWCVTFLATNLQKELILYIFLIGRKCVNVIRALRNYDIVFLSFAPPSVLINYRTNS